MQKTINSILAEINRVILKPPSRPIRLMFMETKALYEIAQNKVKDVFAINEIININDFFNSTQWSDSLNELQDEEREHGIANRKFQKKLCEVLEKYIINFINSNNPKKLLVIEDEDLYNNGFDPIHFLVAYMSENDLVLDKEIPVIWLTIGSKEEYGTSEYRYYKTDSTDGRIIRVAQDNFKDSVLNFKIDD